MSRNIRIHIELLKDVMFLPHNVVVVTPDEFELASHHFKKGTLFTEDWTDEEKNNKHAPNYGWMYVQNSRDTNYQFAHQYRYILDNWTKYPELFRER